MRDSWWRRARPPLRTTRTAAPGAAGVRAFAPPTVPLSDTFELPHHIRLRRRAAGVWVPDPSSRRRDPSPRATWGQPLRNRPEWVPARPHSASLFAPLEHLRDGSKVPVTAAQIDAPRHRHGALAATLLTQTGPQMTTLMPPLDPLWAPSTSLGCDEGRLPGDGTAADACRHPLHTRDVSALPTRALLHHHTEA
jgi:hypothetical protein